MSDDPLRPILERFLVRYYADWDADRVRPLGDYLAAFPGAEEQVAREYLALEEADGEAAEGTAPGGAAEPAARRVGPYRLLEELGRGGQATVYRARDDRLGRDVALKVFRLGLDLAPATVQRIRREAEVAARVDHPGLCTIYDVGHDGERHWIAMQLVAGVTLAQRLEEARRAGSLPDLLGAAPSSGAPSTRAGRVRLVALAVFVERAARAVHAAHESGIVHRDLKPQNLMVRPDGSPVVLDYGLARLAGDDAGLTVTGDVLGTPAYMATEQVRGGTPDPRTDVWALGVTLYECATGRRPFEGRTTAETYDRILRGAPPDPRRLVPGLSEDLRVILSCAMDPDPDRRYPTALALAEDLRRFRSFEPVLARRPGRLLRLQRWAQRNPVLATVVSAALLALAVGVAVLSAKNRQLGRAYADLSQQKAQVQQALADVSRLKARRALAELETEAGELWPAEPARAPALRSWLQRADALLADLPSHEDLLHRIRARADPGGGDGHWTFSRERDPEYTAWLHELLADLVRRLHALAEDGGRRADIAGRLQRAERMAGATIGAYADAWRQCRAAIASSPRYRGLQIEPQLGLVPLGADPHSGLFEFLHWPTHEDGAPLPARDGGGRLRIDTATGVVLVLLPGGTFQMGAELSEQPGPNRDPHCGRIDGPINAVTLDPFLISKYEITQAQWMRIDGGHNPSMIAPGARLRPVTLLHPVEFVDWNRSRTMMRRVGLELPTEAQWEYAMRAGTTTVFPYGDDLESLRGAANLADASARAAGLQFRSSPMFGELDDGFPVHAPVDALRPNGFGLYQMAGNVWEWCLDAACVYQQPARAGDGLRGTGPSSRRMIRGGSWQLHAEFARSASRDIATVTDAQADGGVRPVRALQGWTRAGGPR